MLDLAIVGGSVVDGTGAPPREVNIGIEGGVIRSLDTASPKAKRVIDARGAIVTPGFVDIHAHYDGQASWDDELAPSSWHGVTTTVMGNCGVGFAPARARDRERLIQLMEGVEDIPGSALAEGIRWNWETFAEYMDALAATPKSIDLVAQVPHDALRVYAMGDRAIAGEDATDEDIAAMRVELEHALDAGAAGFSTGRTDNHRAADGSDTPAAEATLRELRGIAAALRGRAHGVLQAVSDFDMHLGKNRFDEEWDRVIALADASGRPVSVSVLQRIGDIDQWRKILGKIEEANRAGFVMRGQVAPRGIGVILGFETTFHPFMGFPTYKAMHALPLAERVQRLRDPETRARLLSETPDKVAGDGSPIPPLADQLLANLDFVSMSLFELAEIPDYEPKRESSLFGKAMQKGQKPLEAILDAMLVDEGRGLLYFPIYNYAAGNLDEVGEMLRHPQTLFGLGDGGAHVGTICDASFPTFLLSHWVKRETGSIPLETAVAMLTARNADWMGLRDRGRLEVGLRADLNVIELDRLSLPRPRLVADLPAKGRRLMQSAGGYRQTIVSGEVVRENGETTTARPGRLVRVR